VPERHWRLLEPRRKRAAFLDIVVRELGLNAEVIVATAAQAEADPGLRGVHAAALARGLAAPAAALEMIAPLVRTGGLAIAFVGERAAVPEVADGSRAGLAIVRSDVARDRAPEA
jgi:16S rRNA G527 N7-methylase RsmG